MADVKGGRGVTGISFSGKGNLEKPLSGKLARELGSTFSKTTMTNPIGRRYGEAIGPMKPKSVPRTFVPPPRKPVPPAVAVLPPVKKPPVQVISNVVRERPTPTKAAPPARAKPPATRFGVVTGTTTGTKTGGGGGYGGGGTRGGGSLSGGGSGSRSAGTSRTGGTKRNDPVRG